MICWLHQPVLSYPQWPVSAPSSKFPLQSTSGLSGYAGMAAREAPARSAADARTASESLYKSVSLVGFRNGEASSFRSPNSGDDPPLPWPLYGQRGACTRERVLRAPVRPRSYLGSMRRLLRRPALRAPERHPMGELPLYGRPGALPLEVRATRRAVARSPVHRDQAVPGKAPRLVRKRKAARLLDGRRSDSAFNRKVRPCAISRGDAERRSRRIRIGRGRIPVGAHREQLLEPPFQTHSRGQRRLFDQHARDRPHHYDEEEIHRKGRGPARRRSVEEELLPEIDRVARLSDDDERPRREEPRRRRGREAQAAIEAEHDTDVDDDGAHREREARPLLHRDAGDDHEGDDDEPPRSEERAIPRVLPEPVSHSREHAPRRDRIRHRPEGVTDSVMGAREEVPDDDPPARRDGEICQRRQHRPADADEDEQRGPEQIELLLYGERPGVSVRPGPVPVVVARVRERVSHVAGTELDEALARGERRHRQEHVIRNEDAEDPAEVEPRQPDGAGVLTLGEEQAGDEESGDDEEDPDPDG